MWARLRKESGIVVATLAALVTFIALEVVYLRTLGRIYFLTGVPTPGGAPLEIHLLNVGLKGAYAALAYALVMRLWFGRAAWARVAVLWVLGLALVSVLAIADLNGFLWPSALFWIGLVMFLVTSLFIARDWVSR